MVLRRNAGEQEAARLSPCVMARKRAPRGQMSPGRFAFMGAEEACMGTGEARMGTGRTLSMFALPEDFSAAFRRYVAPAYQSLPRAEGSHMRSKDRKQSLSARMMRGPAKFALVLHLRLNGTGTAKFTPCASYAHEWYVEGDVPPNARANLHCPETSAQPLGGTASRRAKESVSFKCPCTWAMQ